MEIRISVLLLSSIQHSLKGPLFVFTLVEPHTIAGQDVLLPWEKDHDHIEDSL